VKKNSLPPNFIFKRIHTESKQQKKLPRFCFKGGNIFINNGARDEKKGEKMELLLQKIF